MSIAKKLPSGSWRCQVYSHTEKTWNEEKGEWKDKRIYESFTSDDHSLQGKREAEFAGAEFARTKEKKSRIKSDDITVKTAVRKCIDSKAKVLSPSTLRAYESVFKTYFNYFDNITISKIDSQTVQIWVADLAKKHSPKTVKNAYGILSSAIEMFCPDLRIAITLPAKIKPDLYIPSDSEVSALLDHIKGKELEIAVLLASFGPMRRGEICALNSSDIHGNIVSVNKSMVQMPDKSWTYKQPKTYSSYRNIEFPEFVIEKMSGIDGQIIKATPDQITNRFKRAIKYAGLPHFRFHDLRHYSASIMHAIGVPDQYIMKRGGWSSDATLKSVYRNTIDEQTQKFNTHILHHFEAMQHDIQHDITKAL